MVFVLVFSACLHATWNGLLKKCGDKATCILLSFTTAAVTAALALPLEGGYSLGSGARWALFAGVAEGFYAILLTKTLENAPLGPAYALMRGLAMALVWGFSTRYLGETIGAMQAGGISLIFLGFFVNLTARTGRFRGAGVAWATSCGVAIFAYHVLYDLALREGARPISLFLTSSFVSVPMMLVPLGRNVAARIRALPPPERRRSLAAGFIAFASFALFLRALSVTPPGLALSLRNASIVFSWGLGLWLGERPTLRETLASVAIFAGVLFLAA